MPDDTTRPTHGATGRTRRFGHWKRWLVAGVVAVAVLAVAGPYVYIHFIEGPAPARFVLPKTTASKSGGSAAVPVTGTWKIAGGSQAGYRIGEVLFGQNNTAVGRTSAVTGQMTVNGTTVSAATVIVDLTKVSSDSGQRDSQFQGRIMNTAQFPTTTFTLTQPLDLGRLPTAGTTVNVKATGTLTLRGVTRPVVATLSARQTGGTIHVSGTIPVVFADWSIGNPSFGPATTEDHGSIEFLLSYQHA